MFQTKAQACIVCAKLTCSERREWRVCRSGQASRSLRISFAWASQRSSSALRPACVRRVLRGRSQILQPSGCVRWPLEELASSAVDHPVPPSAFVLCDCVEDACEGRCVGTRPDQERLRLSRQGCDRLARIRATAAVIILAVHHALTCRRVFMEFDRSGDPGWLRSTWYTARGGPSFCVTYGQELVPNDRRRVVGTDSSERIFRIRRARTCCALKRETRRDYYLSRQTFGVMP